MDIPISIAPIVFILNLYVFVTESQIYPTPLNRRIPTVPHRYVQPANNLFDPEVRLNSPEI